MASFGAMPKITHVALFEIIVSSFNCDIITFMKKKSGKNRKHNRANARFYKRLTLICVEVFALVAIVGVSLVLLQASEQEQVSAQLEEAGVTAELLIGTNVSDRAQDHNTTQEEMDTSRYGAELADEEYCKRNRIYAKATISEEEVVLAFAGDVSFAEGYANMGALAQRDGDIRNCFDEFVLKEMQDADIFMLNNEFPYTDRGTPTEGKTFTFRSKPENVKYLYDMGVDIVSVANNHVYDYGEISLLDTLATLEEAAMPYVGAGRNIEEAVKPVYFVANDIKIAYISATQIEQGDYPDTVGAGENTAGVFRCWNDDRIYDVVREAKENADFVIAYIHWGTELSETLHWAQPDQAAKLVEAGADLIVGDHPHCLQEIAYIKGVPVVYSMGNFWFNSKTQDTGILKVAINEKGLQSLQFVPAIQSGCKTTIASDDERGRILNYIQSLSPTIIIDNAGYITKR